MYAARMLEEPAVMLQSLLRPLVYCAGTRQTGPQGFVGGKLEASVGGGKRSVDFAAIVESGLVQDLEAGFGGFEAKGDASFFTEVHFAFGNEG